MIFTSPFRELMSARGHALLQLFLPVDDNCNLVTNRLQCIDHEETVAIWCDVIRSAEFPFACPTPARRPRRAKRQTRVRRDDRYCEQRSAGGVPKIQRPSVRCPHWARPATI